MAVLTSDKIWKLTGCVQHYRWGGQNFIPELMCLANKERKPFAELWFGQHPACSSITSGGTTLSDLMDTSPEIFLTPGEQKKWSNELPYLCKVLDVKDMLSIQIHPDQQQAEKGFRGEQDALNQDADNIRTFRDPKHKPEVMYALSDFYLLHDFRSDEEVIRVLGEIPSLRGFADEVESMGLPDFYRKFMQKSQGEVNKLLSAFVDEMANSHGADDMLSPDFWVRLAIDRFCNARKIDRGILSFYLMNLVYLKPGEVVFQDSGIPHAYLKGQNIEIMANSDNVIRGGLTQKHIDARTLSRLVRFDKRSVHYVRPEKMDGSKIIFRPPVDEFNLSVIELKPYQEYYLEVKHVSLLFSTCNCFVARSFKQELRVGGGEAILIKAGESIVLQSRVAAKVFWVSEGGGRLISEDVPPGPVDNRV